MTGSLGILLQKEWRELRRDRRVLFISLVLPVLLYPALMGGSQRLQARHAEEVQSQRYRLATPLRDGPLFDILAADSTFSMQRAASESLAVAVRSEEVAVAVDATAQLDSVRIFVATTREASREAERRLNQDLDVLRERLLRARMRDESRAVAQLEVVGISTHSVATAAEEGGAKASRIVIYLLLMILYMAGSVLATDAVAGEKERGTLETLFLAPVSRRDIAWSKVLVVASGTAITGLLCLLGLWLSYGLGWVRADDGTRIELQSAALLGIAVLTVPAGALVGTVLLGISTWARSLKEAQTTMLPVMLLLLVPALLSMQQSIEMSPLVALVPVANLAFLMRDLMTGQVQWIWWAMSLLATSLYLVLVLRQVTSMLGREELVLGFDHEPLLAKTPGGRRRATHLSLALALLIYFYLGQWLQARLELTGLALSLWVLLPALIALGLTLTGTWSTAAQTLALRRPRARDLVGAVLLGWGAILPLVGGLQALQNRIMPMPSLESALTEQLSQLGIGWGLLLLAFTPALMEELLFRGFARGVLRKYGAGAWGAIVTSAIYFAAMHMSVHRFVLTFTLGCLLGYVVERGRSVLLSMMLHFSYNGSLIWGVDYFSRHQPPLDPRGPWAWALSAAALLAGHRLLTGGSRPLRGRRPGVS